MHDNLLMRTLLMVIIVITNNVIEVQSRDGSHGVS